MAEVSELAWYKSSYSNGSGGNCIEISAASGNVLVRDSKDPAGPILQISGDAWVSFVASVREDGLSQRAWAPPGEARKAPSDPEIPSLNS